MKYYKNIVFVFFLFTTIFCNSQKIEIDSLNAKQLKFNYKQLILPTVLIGYGLIGIESDNLKLFNNEIKEEVKENIDESLTIDDITQYLPLTTALGLDLVGIKGKNKIKDKAIIAATAILITGISVTSIKRISHVERPDGTSFDSFPSGHTANAFMGAEFLYQEYKDTSIWYGISGYLVASGTGAFRIYNNRHWFTDVVAGAGIGILSTKVAYWLYPTVNKLFTNKNKKETNKKTVFIPYFDRKTIGFGFVSTF